MTRADRHELGVVIRKREKVLKAQAKEHSAVMLADFEAQMARQYHWDEQETWRKAKAAAEAAEAAANKAIVASFKELGIPERFGPSFHMSWYSRGENAIAARRGEFRRVAESRVAAIEAKACAAIERLSLEAQTEVATHGLQSDAARKFLGTLPDITTLMPALPAKEVKQLLGSVEQPDDD
jgi:hypothetical protein